MKRETNMREQEHGKGKRGKSGKTRQRKETTPFGIGHIFRFFYYSSQQTPHSQHSEKLLFICFSFVHKTCMNRSWDMRVWFLEETGSPRIGVVRRRPLPFLNSISAFVGVGLLGGCLWSFLRSFCVTLYFREWHRVREGGVA